MANEELLGDLLRSVSRAFYLSLRILPPRCRTPMATAYLLARAADTIADTESLPPQRRCEHLRAYAQAVREGAGDLGEFAAATLSGEARLLRRLPDTLTLLHELDPWDRELVTGIVSTLAQGMQEDLEHFPPGELRALPDAAALDRHTYMAAGCVGEFWTAILDRHALASRWDSARQKELGIRFGKALQLTNVLRDIPADLRAGRCYLPLVELQRQNLSPADLLDWSNQERTRLVFRRWLLIALDHYRAALDWLDGIPVTHVRLRLSALWPILIGLATLAKLARGNWLHPERVKVSRPWIYRMMLLSVPGSFIPRPWVQAWMMAVEKA